MQWLKNSNLEGGWAEMKQKPMGVELKDLRQSIMLIEPC